MQHQKRRPVYSKSGKPRTTGMRTGTSERQNTIYSDPYVFEDGPSLRARLGAWWHGFYPRHQGKVLVATSVAMTLLIVGIADLFTDRPEALTQRRLNEAVNYALEQRPVPPAETTLAYAQIIRSVVMVSGRDEIKPVPNDPDAEAPEGVIPEEGENPDFHEELAAVGTGVVIDDQGTILTNFHVAIAAERLKVTFMDGTEADARIVGAEPENDLAVLRPSIIPDDLQPAVLASSQGLYPGDKVVAVGFPFGIGPSASAGVISGLNRSFKSSAEDADGGNLLTNLIQFDAAANPGNSGGPLVNMNGEVVGIVTAILNPSGARTFAGIGFALPIETAAAAGGDSPL